ncbi:hypothetical protein AB0N59_13820 [Microbacterium sp. NPDC089321]|uniref:hypothetical protein n=1 Tax=Microbacterium sp. NPDC089321 TaxID=3155183 RepID=UPI0034460659
MELALEDATVILLGVGDELDRVVLRTLASEGAWTYATKPSRSTADLTQHGDASSHWVSVEDHLTLSTVTRIEDFLHERGRPVTTIVLHIDVIAMATSQGPLRWWRLRSEAKKVLRSATDILGTATPARGQSLLLLYQLHDHTELKSASRWMRRTISAIAKRAGAGARVNGVLVGPGDVDSNAAAMIAVFCSSVTERITGALIPMDDGMLVNDLPPEP